MEKVKNKPKPRSKSKKERKAVPGLCLFCNNYYPRDWKLIQNRIISFPNTPKHKRCFKFLTWKLNIKEPKPSIRQPTGGFNFISEIVPLCPSCLIILDQMHSLYLKAQGVKYRLDKCVDKIRQLIADSGTKESEAKLLNVYDENESHFSYFRRQVQQLTQRQEVEGQGQGSESLHSLDSKEYDLVITKPEVKLVHLTEEEINKYKRQPRPPPLIEKEPDLHFMDFDFDFGDEDICHYGIQEEQDIKPDVDEIAEFNLQRVESSPIRILPQTPLCPEDQDHNLVPVPVEEAVFTSNTGDVDVASNIQIISVASQSLGGQLQTEPNFNSNQEGGISEPLQMPILEEEPNLEDSSDQTSIKIKRRRTIFPKSEGQNDCKLCPLPLTSQDKLITHYKSVHPGLFPIKCTYPSCPFGCFPQSELRKHILSRHGPYEEREKKKKKECPECGKKFLDNKGLDYHIKTHTGEKPFKCDQCGRAFRQRQGVENHVFRVHNDIKNFICPHCPWRFKDKASLNNHIAIHTGEKKFVCHICGTKRIQFFALKAHFKVHVKRGDWVEPPPEKKKKGRFYPTSRKQVKKKTETSGENSGDGEDPPGLTQMEQDT